MMYRYAITDNSAIIEYTSLRSVALRILTFTRKCPYSKY